VGLSIKVSCAYPDKFFKRDSLIPITNGIVNWDCPEAIDFDAFYEYLCTAKSSSNCAVAVGPNRPALDFSQLQGRQDELHKLAREIKKKFGSTKIGVVDGFLLYTYPHVERVFDMKIFLYADKGTLIKRRSERESYITEEGSWTDPPGYFEDIVWPNYLEYNKNALENSASEYILFDTSSLPIVNVVYEALHRILNAQL
jgi:uridine kinase